MYILTRTGKYFFLEQMYKAPPDGLDKRLKYWRNQAGQTVWAEERSKVIIAYSLCSYSRPLQLLVQSVQSKPKYPHMGLHNLSYC